MSDTSGSIAGDGAAALAGSAAADRFFPSEEYERRLAVVRAHMEERGLSSLLLVSPESIYYFTGLNHMGYFAFTLLVIPKEGDLGIVTRSMEGMTLAAQAPDLEHIGFQDDESPGEAAAAYLSRRDVGNSGRVGIERSTMYLPVVIWEEMVRHTEAQWEDATDLVRGMRAVKSPLEIQCTREAAALSDRALRAGIKTAGVGVNEREVAAELYRSLVLGGSEYPGFAPLVRSAEMLFHEHVTWRDRTLVPGDVLFMELSASVRRYHAPLTRFVYLGSVPDRVDESADVITEGLEEVRKALVPGTPAGEVYAKWQAVIDRALGEGVYGRHHCGYMVGIGFPPSWMGGPSAVGLRRGSDVEIKEGMVFHVLSWMLGQALPDYGVSDTMLVTADGGEILTSTGRRPTLLA